MSSEAWDRGGRWHEWSCLWGLWSCGSLFWECHECFPFHGCHWREGPWMDCWNRSSSCSFLLGSRGARRRKGCPRRQARRHQEDHKRFPHGGGGESQDAVGHDEIGPGAQGSSICCHSCRRSLRRPESFCLRELSEPLRASGKLWTLLAFHQKRGRLFLESRLGKHKWRRTSLVLLSIWPWAFRDQIRFFLALAQQSPAITSLVAHLTSGADPMSDLSSSGWNHNSVLGPGESRGETRWCRSWRLGSLTTSCRSSNNCTANWASPLLPLPPKRSCMSPMRRYWRP